MNDHHLIPIPNDFRLGSAEKKTSDSPDRFVGVFYGDEVFQYDQDPILYRFRDAPTSGDFERLQLEIFFFTL